MLEKVGVYTSFYTKRLMCYKATRNMLERPHAISTEIEVYKRDCRCYNAHGNEVLPWET